MQKKVLYAGDYGSFSWEAACQLQAANPTIADAELVESLSPPRTIERLWSGEGDFAVIPVFNSNLGGPIPSTMEGFAKVKFPVPDSKNLDTWLANFIAMHRDQIIGDPLPLPIRFAIHAKRGISGEQITRLVGYSMAVEQCRIGLARVLGGDRADALQIVGYSDTAKAAQDADRLIANPEYKNPYDPEPNLLLPLEQTGILGPVWCPEIFTNLRTVYNDVQDNPVGNVTTFVLMHRPSNI